MLVIRDEQMHALGESRFADWLGQHVGRFFPERCLTLGAAATSQAIADALARARAYGFKEPADLCRFVDIVFAFGPQFDCDEGLPWASELLQAADITDASERMDLLIAAAKAHLRPRAEASNDAGLS